MATILQFRPEARVTAPDRQRLNSEVINVVPIRRKTPGDGTGECAERFPEAWLPFVRRSGAKQ